MHRVLDWWRAHDANLSALRRAARTAVVLPSVLALAFKVIDNPTMSTFAAFGSIALLLLVDFGGTRRNRLACQLTLIAVGCVLITVGTLASFNAWVATAVALVVGFAVLFAGAVSSAAAAAGTSALLSFILPVAMPADAGTIPDRLFGWLLTGAVSVLAVAFFWPGPRQDPLRASCARAGRQIVDRLTTRDAAPGTGHDAVAELRSSFYRTPYRPAGVSTANRAILRLVDEMSWLGRIVDQLPAARSGSPVADAVARVEQASAALLDRATRTLESTSAEPPDDVQHHLDAVVTARRDMASVVVGELPGAGTTPDDETAALSASFRAHQLSFAVVGVASNVETVRRAEGRTWWQKLAGRRVGDATTTAAAVHDRLESHWRRDSVWLHNSIRGAIGLAVAVLVADLTQLEHSFWIVLGALSVLRSSALTTGQNVVRAIAGTILGFVVGGVIVFAIGAQITVLWVLLPVVILFAGTGPAVSFLAGQAGFTMTVLFLFNIISPAGWQIGFLRVENVAIGCAVSIVVGALLWPRGATAELSRTLSEAYADCAAYLRETVHDVGRSGAGSATQPPPDPSQQPVGPHGTGRQPAAWRTGRHPAASPPGRHELRADDDLPHFVDALAPAGTAPAQVQALRSEAAAAARRLDDAFRGFLAERGAKHLPLADVATLVFGVAALRLSTAAVLDLWHHRDLADDLGDGSARTDLDDSPGRAGLDGAADAIAGWYSSLAQALAGGNDVPAELVEDVGLQRRLLTEVQRDRFDQAGRAAAVRAVWTADQLAVAVHLQHVLEAPARAANTYVRQARTRPHWWFGPGHAPDVPAPDGRPVTASRDATPSGR